jgi:hypothetical protein
MQLRLFPRSGEIIPATLTINEADDDVPHDRTPSFNCSDLIAGVCFRLFSQGRKAVSSAPEKYFIILELLKRLHEIASSSPEV